jgi:predicted TIM-barrel fold metal-dependent hydrolase
MSNTSTTQSEKVQDELLIVDCDTHLSEPWDLWTSRAPEKYKDRVPQVKEVQGQDRWVFDDIDIGPARSAAVVDKALVKHYGASFHFKTNVYEVAAAASQVKPRVELMDAQGVWAQILYPNAVGFGGQQIGKVGETALRNLAVELYNDAIAEMQAESGNRIFGMGVVPWWDIESGLDELERIKNLGMVGINLSADPQEYGFPDLSETYWTPLFEAIEGYDLTLNFHIGASATQENYHGTAPWPSMSQEEKSAIGSAVIYLSNARVLANFIFGGIFERHPRLRLASVESGVGWLPFFLQALDWQLVETAPSSRQKLSLTPSEYFRRQCAACFWFENDLLVESINSIGVDNCLFETDFPHPTCLYPDPIERVLKVFEGQSMEFTEKVLGKNAIGFYNLPVPLAG